MERDQIEGFAFSLSRTNHQSPARASLRRFNPTRITGTLPCRMSKILILSAAVGAGHLRAAQAVEVALRQLAPEATVENVDVLSLTNAAFRRVYGKTYLDLVNKAPHVLGYFYDLSDRPRGPKSKRDKLRLLAEKVNVKRCTDLICKGGWDVIVNTHFLPAEMIASLPRSRKAAHSADHGHDRFRDASPLGQRAVRDVHHRHR